MDLLHTGFCSILLLLLLDAREKSKDSVNDEKCANDDNKDAERVSKGEDKSHDHSKYGENNVKNSGFFRLLDSIDKVYKSLNGNKYTENEKNYINYQVTKQYYRNTDNKADDTAGNVFLYYLDDTGNDKENSGNCHCDLNSISGEYNKENAYDNIQQSGKDIEKLMVATAE